MRHELTLLTTHVGECAGVHMIEEIVKMDADYDCGIALVIDFEW